MKRSLLLISIGCVAVFLLPFVAAAQEKKPCKIDEYGFLEAPFPDMSDSICTLISGETPLTTYAQILINFFTAFVVGIGLIMIVVAGYMYMTAGGNGSRVDSAKTIIKTALLGIVLALAAYTILYTIGGDQFFQEPQFNLPTRPAPN